MLVVQISDTHLVGAGLLKGRVDTAANLEAVLGLVQGAPSVPDLLVLSGDLVHDGSTAAYEHLRLLVEPVSSHLGCPVLYVPGNHDVRATFRSVLLGGAPSAGPIDQVLTVKGWRVLALDSVVEGHDHGELDEGQLGWLADQLSEPAERGSVVVLHHPPIPSPIELMSRISLRRPGELAGVILSTDVVAVLCGHYHHATAGMLASVPVFVAPATAYQADVLVGSGVFLGFPGCAFSRVELGDDGSASATVVMVPLAEADLSPFGAVSTADLGLD